MDSMAQFLFNAKEKTITLVHIYKGMKKNVERFSQKYYFWRRGWRGEDKLLKFAIMLLCLTCRNRYLIEIIPVSVLAEVL